ncbi:MAG: DUF2442 domain-containing protein [Pontiellaceae bacterium]|nr:DUF2442 domain-containing protein [Pontiellaceae bacterium]
MNYDVIKAEYVEGYRLSLEFFDGSTGVVDFLPFIEKGGVFGVLKDVEQFKRFSIDPDWKTITWQDGEVDFAPETLYREAMGYWPERKPLMQVAEESTQYGASSD